MIERRLLPVLRERLDAFPVVVLLGPRQAGKTTLALEVAKTRPSVYLDLESEADLAKLSEPELYLREQREKLVILDEIHRKPELLPVLRGLVDEARRTGFSSGRYLLLGSASLDLLQKTSESLAGRVSYLELAPFDALEVGNADRLWLRGGFPPSYLAPGEEQSFLWRRDFLRTYWEREIPFFGGRLPAATLRRFWIMLAHLQGEPMNKTLLAESLDLDARTVGRYLDLIEDLYLLRKLPPWFTNVRKRVKKTPRLYLRDSGLLHALLNLKNADALLAHPVVGKSWEGFAIENLLRAVGDAAEGFFYQAGGAEVDLLLAFGPRRIWAIEVMRSLSPRPKKGFYRALKDLDPEAAYVVYPGEEEYPLSQGVRAVPLETLMRRLSSEPGQTHLRPNG